MLILSILLGAALAVAQDPPEPVSVRVTYTHLPLNVYRAAIGKELDRVGLYSATACNVSDTSAHFAEGLLIIHAGRFGVIDPVLNNSLIEKSKQATTKYKVFRVGEYVGAGVGVAGGPSAGKTFQFITRSVGSAFGVFAASVKQTKELPPEIVQALVQTPRRLVLSPGDCASRLMFGEYRKSFAPYDVDIPVHQIP